jgi:hypothetical protein
VEQKGAEQTGPDRTGQTGPRTDQTIPKLSMTGSVWSGPVWSGPVWSSLVWSGPLVRSGLVWSSLVWSGHSSWVVRWSGPVRSGPVRSGLVQSSPLRSGPGQSGLVWTGPVHSGWSGQVRSGLVSGPVCPVWSSLDLRSGPWSGRCSPCFVGRNTTPCWLVHSFVSEFV